jgi:hypothetical protein
LRGKVTHVIADPDLVASNTANTRTGLGIDPDTTCIAHLRAALTSSIDISLLPVPASNGNAEGLQIHFGRKEESVTKGDRSKVKGEKAG